MPALPCLGIAIGSFRMMLGRGEQLDWILLDRDRDRSGAGGGVAFYLVPGPDLATVKHPVHRSGDLWDRTLWSGLCFIFAVGIILVRALR